MNNTENTLRCIVWCVLFIVALKLSTHAHSWLALAPLVVCSLTLAVICAPRKS